MYTATDGGFRKLDDGKKTSGGAMPFRCLPRNHPLKKKSSNLSPPEQRAPRVTGQGVVGKQGEGRGRIALELGDDFWHGQDWVNTRTSTATPSLVVTRRVRRDRLLIKYMGLVLQQPLFQRRLWAIRMTPTPAKAASL